MGNKRAAVIGRMARGGRGIRFSPKGQRSTWSRQPGSPASMSDGADRGLTDGTHVAAIKLFGFAMTLPIFAA